MWATIYFIKKIRYKIAENKRHNMNINFKPIEVKGKMILSFFLGVSYLLLVIKSIFSNDKKFQNKVFELSNNISNSLSGKNNQNKRINEETNSDTSLDSI